MGFTDSPANQARGRRPAAERTAGSSRPTMAMVAARVGVSKQTVHYALNAPERLSPATVRRVLKAVEELGYRPNQAARSLSTKSPRAVGFRLLPTDRESQSGGILASYLYELSLAARQADHAVFCHAAATDEEEIRVIQEIFSTNTVDSFVITNTQSNDPRITFLLERGVPFVSFGRPWGNAMSDTWWVDVDGAAGMEQAVDHLAEHGHRRIAYLDWGRPSGIGDDRESGWRRAMGAHGFSTRDLAVRGSDDIGSGRQLAGRLLDRKTPPTAFVCVSDTVAIGALNACRERGLVAGRDVGVVGFDDSVGARVVTPGLTSLAQPLDLAARHTVRLLLELLRDTGAKPEQVLLRPSLVVRESTVPL
ncbi:LacI family DNA-binding transcriptional regulator [Terrabacter sp. MAHUQ-38]|uniref:LacI family DNA-binding transcriptional regulator n=1 Tax=unclassified Terrabacter TaxID=2630222 RepID=UPI00165EAB40|nr:LacI family DNA-binding transcriptional regulator [Terrabacter sp. MAHUQ-38]MBC9822387.1 LacI family DNA-binding transcriptional regulator [Terrabacter sp. MAHUQ-38]